MPKVSCQETINDLEKGGIASDKIEALLCVMEKANLEGFIEILGKDNAIIKDILTVQGTLEDISDWFQFDPSIVRGLEYYTGERGRSMICITNILILDRNCL